MRFGVHMPLKGGFENNLRRLSSFGCRTVQIFPGNPTGWKMAEADPKEIERRINLLGEHDITPLVIHSAYLINLASNSSDVYQKSRRLLKLTMEKAALYRSPYVILHTGNHGGQGKEAGLEQIMSTIAEELPDWPGEVKLLLENTAGSGTALGSHFEELARVVKVFPPEALGICLDTAHAWAAGYQVDKSDGVAETLQQFDRLIGLERLEVIHINDSKAARGSRVDRHEHIGRGYLGLDGFKALLAEPWPGSFPMILETPEIGSCWDQYNLELLYSLVG